jgi:hypothetical protein
MVDHKLVDGVKVVLSDEEIAQRAAEEALLGMLVHLIEL